MLHQWNGIVNSTIFDICRILNLLKPVRRILGPIPDALGDLELLQTLNLDGNHLSGNLPNKIFSDQLEILNLSGNNLSGTIPLEVGNALFLQILDLQDNSFSGHLPTQVQRLQFLEILNIGLNAFAGPIPTFLGWDMPRLELTNLSSSGFTGDMPDTYCSDPIITIDVATNMTNASNLLEPIPNVQGKRKIFVVDCTGTGLCECCEHRKNAIEPGEIAIECSEELVDV